jgi:hypothetical protein
MLVSAKEWIVAAVEAAVVNKQTIGLPEQDRSGALAHYASARVGRVGDSRGQARPPNRLPLFRRPRPFRMWAAQSPGESANSSPPTPQPQHPPRGP